jgi:hypothetical protein
MALTALCLGCGDGPQQALEGTRQGDGNHTSSSPIVGEWSAVHWSLVRTVDGETVVDVDMDRDEFVSARRVFKSDGTGYEQSNFSHDGGDNWQTVQTFKWTLSSGKIVFSDVEHINPPGILIDRIFYFSESDWTVHELASEKLRVSYTRIINDPDTPVLPDERENHSFTYEKLK